VDLHLRDRRGQREGGREGQGREQSRKKRGRRGRGGEERDLIVSALDFNLSKFFFQSRLSLMAEPQSQSEEKIEGRGGEKENLFFFLLQLGSFIW
jgi:hypothetical protein